MPKMTLLGLASIQLSDAAQSALAGYANDSRGGRVWRERKSAEMRDLLALEQLASRLSVQQVDMTTDLRVVLGMLMPVPCRFGSGDLVVCEEAVVGIQYQEQCMLRALPGPAFAQVLWPMGVFHPSIKRGPVQAVCLGITVPPGIRLIEIVLMLYRAVVLQEHNFDERDHAGVFNVEAARWWQENTHRIPLTTETFLDPSRMARGDDHA